ncbi:protein kinase [Streptomyces sp. ISL-11]|uniref:serine/threonine-protein kinase n=1 Tax=Streptomyces sp. ISL-11 TaxID=2819174 RepID=UPI001BE6241E|nr:protein kinase [Streptomyces sp. ISL-11]MBT2385240.1 PQQ-binding-like beta-propeller repeat protein [Streptomyces sp. ISL-11]
MPSPLAHDDPQQLGAYRLIARLGSGGMGTVYLGRSRGGRTVALKTMHARFAADPELRTRFRLEIDAARVIGGQHGAAVVDADPFAPTAWLATEYVLGPPLDDAVALCGPLPERSVRALGAALCDALGQLHRSDVVHRDLKPSNILVTAFGPKVIDFGIARAIGDDRLTRTGTAAGTPAFMSPEQATGVEHTSAGDVFALAGVLLFAATGHGPFGGGQPADLLYRVRYAEPDLSGAPPELLPVLARCLSKDPVQRPGTAELALLLDSGDGEFVDRLPDALLTEIARRSTEVWRVQPHRVPAPLEVPDAESAPGGRVPGMSRRKLLTIAGGSALGAAAAGGAMWAAFERSEGDARPKTASHARPANVPSRAVWWTKVDKTDAGLPPMVAGELIVVMADKSLVGLDAKTGEKRWVTKEVTASWQVTTDGEQIYAAIPGSGGAAVGSVRLKDGRLEPLGERLTEFDGRPSYVHALAAADGVVYLVARKWKADEENSESGWHVVAFDVRTREERWRRPFNDVYHPSMPLNRIAAKPVGDSLLLTRPESSGHADGLGVRDVVKGDKTWSWSLPRKPHDLSSFLLSGAQLATDDERAYFGSGTLQAFRTASGKKAWEFGDDRDKGDLGQDERPYGRPAVRDGVVYVTEGSQRIVAVAAGNGKPLWDAPFDGLTPNLAIPPVVGRKFVYAAVTASGPAKIAAVDLHTHRTAWVMDIPGGLDASLTAHEHAGRIVWTSGDFVCAIALD